MLDGKDHPSTPRTGNLAGTYSNARPTMVMPSGTFVKIPRRPFYRTRSGIIIIIMVFVAIVAIVVGCAVALQSVSAPRNSVPSNSVPSNVAVTSAATTELQSGVPQTSRYR